MYIWIPLTCRCISKHREFFKTCSPASKNIMWAVMDHPWVSGSPTHHCHTVTKQSDLAHYWGPLRRPLQYHCTLIHLLATLFSHNTLESQAARNSMQKIGIAHTVNFNQSPLLCVSPACLVFGIPLRSGWPRWRRTEESGSSWLQGEVWRMEGVGCGGGTHGDGGCGGCCSLTSFRASQDRAALILLTSHWLRWQCRTFVKLSTDWVQKTTDGVWWHLVCTDHVVKAAH